MTQPNTSTELREQLRPHCDEILRHGAKLYKSGNILGGRKEVDDELDAIMQLIISHNKKLELLAKIELLKRIDSIDSQLVLAGYIKGALAALESQLLNLEGEKT